MKTFARDTCPEAHEVQVGIWRSWTPQKRLESACSLSQSVRRRVVQAIRDQCPNRSEDELRIELLRRLYGEDVAGRVARQLGILVDV